MDDLEPDDGLKPPDNFAPPSSSTNTNEKPEEKPVITAYSIYRDYYDNLEKRLASTDNNRISMLPTSNKYRKPNKNVNQDTGTNLGGYPFKYIEEGSHVGDFIRVNPDGQKVNVSLLVSKFRNEPIEYYEHEDQYYDFSSARPINIAEVRRRSILSDSEGEDPTESVNASDIYSNLKMGPIGMVALQELEEDIKTRAELDRNTTAKLPTQINQGIFGVSYATTVSSTGVSDIRVHKNAVSNEDRQLKNVSSNEDNFEDEESPHMYRASINYGKPIHLAGIKRPLPPTVNNNYPTFKKQALGGNGSGMTPRSHIGNEVPITMRIPNSGPVTDYSLGQYSGDYSNKPTGIYRLSSEGQIKPLQPQTKQVQRVRYQLKDRSCSLPNTSHPANSPYSGPSLPPSTNGIGLISPQQKRFYIRGNSRVAVSTTAEQMRPLSGFSQGGAQQNTPKETVARSDAKQQNNVSTESTMPTPRYHASIHHAGMPVPFVHGIPMKLSEIAEAPIKKQGSSQKTRKLSGVNNKSIQTTRGPIMINPQNQYAGRMVSEEFLPMGVDKAPPNIPTQVGAWELVQAAAQLLNESAQSQSKSAPLPQSSRKEGNKKNRRQVKITKPLEKKRRSQSDL